MNVAVVGGGVTGLTAAHALLAGRHEVVVFERRRRLGGKLRTERVEGFLVEAGPDSFLARGPTLPDLCRRVGLDRELIGLKPPRRVFVHGRGALHPLPSGVRLVPTDWVSIARSGLFSPGEKLRAGLDRVRRAEPIESDISVGALVRRRFGRAILDRLTGPLIGGIYAADPDGLSAVATFPELLEAARSGSMMAALRTRGVSRDARFMSLADGMESLASGLGQAIGEPRLRCGTEVIAIGPDGDGFAVEAETGRLGPFDAVIVAVPAHSAAPLLREAAPDAAASIGTIDHVSTAVVTLGYRAVDVAAPEGHGFVVARDQPSEITACSWSSSKWEGRAPAGRVLLRAFMGSAERPVDLDRSDEHLADRARRALREVMGVTAAPVLVRVHRWPDAMPQYGVGHVERVEAIERSLDSVGRIVVAGSGYRGVGIERCVRQALRAARRCVD